MSDRASGLLGTGFRSFTVSLAALQAARFGFTIAVAAAVPPQAFTVWALVLAAMAYLPLLTGGAINGIGRELPYLLGAGRAADVAPLEASMWRAVGAGIVVLAMLAGTLTLTLEQAEPLAVGAVLAVTLAFQAQQAVLRARLAFRRASLEQGVLAATLLGATAAVGGGVTGSFAGVTAAYALAVAGAVAFGLRLQPPVLRGATWRDAHALVRIGVPLTASGVAFGLFVTSDRWTATALLSTSEAAPYALASVVGAAMLVPSSAISQQMYPRMSAAWGATHDVLAVLGLSSHQGRVAAAITVPGVLVTAVGCSVLIPSLLPQYDGAALAATLVAGGLAAYAAFAGFGNFLNVVGAHAKYLRLQLAAVVLGLAPMVVGGLLAGVAGVATGATVAFAGYGLCLRFSALRVAHDLIGRADRGDAAAHIVTRQWATHDHAPLA